MAFKIKHKSEKAIFESFAIFEVFNLGIQDHPENNRKSFTKQSL